MDALTYVFSAAMVASLKGVVEPAASPPAQVGSRGLAREVREGARWAYGGSGLRRLALSTHVWFAGQAVLLVLVVLYGYLELGLTSLRLGMVFAVAGLGALLGASMSTAVGPRLGTGGAIICAYSVSALGGPRDARGGIGADGLGWGSGPGHRTAVPRLGHGDQQLP